MQNHLARSFLIYLLFRAFITYKTEMSFRLAFSCMLYITSDMIENLLLQFILVLNALAPFLWYDIECYGTVSKWCGIYSIACRLFAATAGAWCWRRGAWASRVRWMPCWPSPPPDSPACSPQHNASTDMLLHFLWKKQVVKSRRI